MASTAQIRLAASPVGMAHDSDFETVTVELPITPTATEAAARTDSERALLRRRAAQA